MALVAFLRDALEVADDLLDTPVCTASPANNLHVVELSALPLPARAHNCLRRAGHVTVADLAGLTWRDLLLLRNFGLTTLIGTVSTLDHLTANPELLPIPAASSGNTRGEQIPNVPTDPIEVGAWLLEHLFAATDPRQRDVVVHRYGLDGDPVYLLTDLGETWGVSSERIRQVQLQALRRILDSLHIDPATAVVRARISQELGGDSAEPWATLAAEVWPGAPAQAGGLLFILITGSTTAKTRWDDLFKAWISELDRQARHTATDRRQADRADARLAPLLSKAWWPAWARSGEPSPRTPTRSGGAEETIGFPSDKLGRRLACESMLEHDVFTLFERSTQVAWYCEQPVAIAYQHDGHEHRYYPDALVHLNDGRMLLVEVKPLYQASLSINLAKWAEARRWCNHHGIGFLITDGRTGLDDFLSAPHKAELTRALIELAAQKAAIDWPSVKRLRSRLSFGTNDLTRSLHAAGLEVDLRPWRARTATAYD